MAQCGTGSTQEDGKTSRMSEKLLTGTYCMCRVRNFCQGGGGGGQARLPENSSEKVFFSPQII